ncbi:hypothetical protein CIK05_07030 [Bdellovibrio sp. qaytius]|nr:hypothetical protein CIK05_07030 [Bdellovibrio sp. qaytius]
MKKSTLLLSLLATTMFISFGCVKAPKDPNKDLDAKLAQIDTDFKKQMDDIDKSLANLSFLNSTDGGQPGNILLNGVIVTDTDKIDSRISVSLKTGLNKDASSTPEVSKDIVQLNTFNQESIEKNKKIVTDLEANRTFINIGCELAESEIAGLTDATNTIDLNDIKNLKASRIFICGEIKVNGIFLSIIASDVMLRDASIIQNKHNGVMIVYAKSLVLEGKSQIQTIGEDSNVLIMPSSRMVLYVANEIYGDGSLVLESIGGNYVDKAEATK